MTDHPLSVTIVMPVRNESSFIARSLKSVLDQDYPAELLEIIVVDGNSEDRTAELASVQLASDKRGVASTVLKNPKRVVPVSLNQALKIASGDVIIRVDGHCELPTEYVSRCIEMLHDTSADCVGGALNTVGLNPVERAVAVAQSHPFGVGGAAFRTGAAKAGPVDTLAFGAYRRTVFERVGLFDEELIRNQDDEFNFRITQSGGTIWMDPTVECTYFARGSWLGLWRQYHDYGKYKVLVIKKRGAFPSLRHLVPAGFVLALVLTFAIAIFGRDSRLAIGLGGSYLAANCATSLSAAADDVSPGRLVLAFSIMHTAYGVGFIRGLGHWRS